jgi:ATP-dependent RNA circularization protein (DNA/RNA ligase family)
VSVIVEEMQHRNGDVRVILKRLRSSSTDKIRSVLNGRGE